jgi:preprotein translocase SecE subunit
MATAVEPGSQPRTPSAPMSLLPASLFGAVYVVASIAVVFYAVPAFWAEYAAAPLGNLNLLARIVAQSLAIAGLLWFGRTVLADGAPKGIHGGIFLVISWAIAIFFIWRAFALNLEGTPGMIIGGVFALFLVYLAVRSFTVGRSGRWAVSLEEQGWFSTASYKKSLGIRARRLTILGILLVGGSGVYSLMFQGTLSKNWAIALPFENLKSFVVIPDAQVAVPVLLALFTLWFAWRLVNVPTFAEFLIATEAEMNKVSWTPKKRLAQDTVVVLTTTLILTLFLLVVDLFWGWLLSRPIVGVLPSAPAGKAEQAVQSQW